MHINRFLHGHLDDMARTNRFNVEIHGPMGINSRGIRCTNVAIPGRTISTVDHKLLSAAPIKAYPSFVDYGGSIDLSFILDSTFEDHQKISLWNSYIYDEAWGFRYPEDYWGTVKITQLDRQDFPIYEVELLEAWPVSFGELTYDSAGGSEIQTFTCTFKYYTWVSSYENSPSGLLGGLFKKASRKLSTKITSEIEGKIFR